MYTPFRNSNLASAEDVIPVGDWLRVVSGLDLLLWGLPVLYLLFIGILDIRVPDIIRLPVYVFGLLIIHAGLIRLYRAPRLTPRWRAHLHRAIAISLLGVYFAPFYYWWNRQPATLYFAVNFLGLLLCMGGLLLSLHAVAHDIGRALSLRSFRAECRLAALATVVLWGLPVSFLMVFAYRSGVWGHLPDDRQVILSIPLWTHVAMVFPFLMTMAVLAKARSCALRSAVPDTSVGGSAF